MWVDEGGLIFYLVYEFERLRLLPGLDRSISNNCSSSNRTNNARAGFAPDELLGSGTTQPRPCIISSNTFATDKGRCDRSLARSAWESTTPKEPSRRVRCDSGRCTHRIDRERLWRLHAQNALAASQIMSISVSRSFRKRSIPRAAARTRSDLSRRVFSLSKEARFTSRREIPLGSAAPDHTVPYGTVLSEDAFPGTSCQATIGVSLRDALAEASQRHLSRELASNFVTPCEGTKHPKLPLT